MSQFDFDQISVILLDMEGTTTPTDYMFTVLFPFAQTHLEAFFEAHHQSTAVQSDLKRLRQEYELDIAQGLVVPEWKDSPIPYIRNLIQRDRKSTGLKSLQGKIWEQGFRAGTLRSRIFLDVLPAFQRWTEAGKRLFIFSSGSVLAQQLLFRYTEVGDLTPFLSGYFDTETGAKTKPESYQQIAQAINAKLPEILFISDATAELQAAQTAGIHPLFSIRPGNRSCDPEEFSAIDSFDKVGSSDDSTNRVIMFDHFEMIP